MSHLPLRYAIMASGNGITAEAIIRATMEGGVLHGLVEVSCLIVSRHGAGVIKRAKALGMMEEQIHIICPGRFSDPADFGYTILEALEFFEANLYGQHGWIPKTPANVVNSRFHGLNQHPAPVPEFGGQGMYGRAPHAAILYFRRMSGIPINTASVAHLVTANYDEGGVIAQTEVAVLDGDTPWHLQYRVLNLEASTMISAILRIVEFGGKVPSFLPSFLSDIRDKFDPEMLSAAKAEAIQQYPRG